VLPAARQQGVVVVFLGTDARYNAYLPRLGELPQNLREKGVTFVGVNATNQDAEAKIAGHAKEHKLRSRAQGTPPTSSPTSWRPGTRQAFVLDARARWFTRAASTTSSASASAKSVNGNDLATRWRRC